MAFTSTLVPSTVENTPAPASSTPNTMAPLLATLLLTVYAAQSSKKQLRKLKRQAVLALFKYKMQATFARVKSLFSKDKKIDGISNTTLLYILLGLLVLILIFVEPIIAIAVLLLGILLILLTR